ncbi:MAG: MFS transporter [Anaerolineae bacterium]|nr:MFS transporter [Anaerolineae bacterium]
MTRFRTLVRRRLRGPAFFLLTFLAIEFLDEFIFGAHEAAWPLIRADLGLTYEQIGLLMSLPRIVGSLIEPALAILADLGWRRRIVLAGGAGFALSSLLTGTAGGFWALLIGQALFNPSSGAFVSLSQSTLMDMEPRRHEQNMARWTFAGSVGVLAGALTLGAASALGLGWRPVYILVAIMAVVALVAAWRVPFASIQKRAARKLNGSHDANGDSAPVDAVAVAEASDLKTGAINALRALRRPSVLRWLILLEFSDLMLDVLYSYLALYLVDVAGVEMGAAAFGVAVWVGVGLVGDFLVIPLLERVRGLVYVRISALVTLVLFPAFLLVPGFAPKLILLGLIGFFNAGWYSVLQGHLYTSMPGQSGAVHAVGNVFGLVGSLIPLAIGLAAERVGLGSAIWLLMLGPAALLIGLPRRANGR